mmetsp:Transcript_32576/g.62291  ORF Transcript_32576/g.62291 Transcript_32576/m.62291 type:complete len:91 (+) Transcript_32576:200-472(+)
MSMSQRKDDAEYAWNESTMSQPLRRMRYDVRGEIVARAEKLRAEGRDIIFTNIGNSQGKSISFCSLHSWFCILSLSHLYISLGGGGLVYF